MKAFNDKEAIREAFCQASGHIALRVGTRQYLSHLHKERKVRGLIEFVLAEYVPAGDIQLGYDQLELPDNVILLVLGILRALPKSKRQLWLNKIFKSIATGADLDQMQIWPRYIRWLVLHRMPRPIPHSVEPRDMLLRTARRAVKGVINLIFEDSYDPDAWSAARFAINDIKQPLYSYLRLRKEFDSIMGGEHPALAPVYFALALVNQRRDESNFFFIDSIVSTAATTRTPIKKQANVLLRLLF